MTLQAWLDDSGSKGTGRVLGICGLIGRAKTFALVADEWDRELRSRSFGRIAYFKMDEAVNLKREFRHWRPEARDQKVKRLGRIIDRSDLRIIAGMVSLDAHKKLEEAVGKRVADAKLHVANQPYLMAFNSTLLTIAYESRASRVVGTVEIVFDNHDKFKHVVREQYPVLVEQMEPTLRARMPEQPFFRDDKEFVVLQAADLVANYMRMTMESLHTNRSAPVIPSWEPEWTR